LILLEVSTLTKLEIGTEYVLFMIPGVLHNIKVC
jgi:hypothetical protein